MCVGRVFRNRYEIRHKSIGWHHSMPFIPTSHPDHTTYAERQFAITAHEHEIWGVGVIEVAELVIVECTHFLHDRVFFMLRELLVVE